MITAMVLPLPAAAPGAPAGAAAASDGPGAVSHQDQSRKDCVGTARNTTSKIWYSIADGVLSDVYAPTVDATNVETLQYLVTDGSTFTDLQSHHCVLLLPGRSNHDAGAPAILSGPARPALSLLRSPRRRRKSLEGRHAALT